MELCIPRDIPLTASQATEGRIACKYPAASSCSLYKLVRFPESARKALDHLINTALKDSVVHSLTTSPPVPRMSRVHQST